MKKLLYIGFLLCTIPGVSQTINYRPPRYVVMVSANSDGLPPYVPYPAASGVDPVNSTPPYFVPMCSSDGLPPYSQCDFSGGGGTPGGNPNSVQINLNGVDFFGLDVNTPGFLHSAGDGSAPTWQSVSGGTPGGNENAVQLNDGAGGFNGADTNTPGFLHSAGDGTAPLWQSLPATPTPFAIDVTSVGAACDGVTNDSSAIQSCLDNNGACFIPTGPSAPTQCEIPDGITLCSSNNHFGFNALFGNGQFLDYTPTTGTAITMNCGILDGVNVSMSATTGSPKTITVNGSLFADQESVTIKNTSDAQNTNLTPGTYDSVFVNSPTGGLQLLLYSGYWFGNLDFVNGTQIEVEDSFYSELHVTGGQAIDINSTVFEDGTNSEISGGSSISLHGDTFLFGLTVDSGAQVSFNSVLLSNSTLTTDVSDILNGDIEVTPFNSPPINGSTFIGSLTVNGSSNGQTWVYKNGIISEGFFYSVAGTALPSCGSSRLSSRAQVGDANSPTFLGNYTGGGSTKAQVFCDGTNWKIY